MAAVVDDMKVEKHHAAKVLAHLAYREDGGLTVIEVCESQADLESSPTSCWRRLWGSEEG